MPNISADALQMELARLLRLLADARAAGDLALIEFVTAEVAELVKGQQQQHQQVETDKQADTSKGEKDA